uniref:Uncharacterized protein LOC114329250 n=1 Tax=Diabrotica virgifera virgifera TaxID=50390 RepID=A0A6P7FED9_DIAVI
MAQSQYFKVVHVLKTGEIEPVPHQWEVNGTLYWPQNVHLVRKFQSKVDSVPDKRTWKTYSCSVKETNIPLFMYASASCQKFIDAGTTATEDEDDEAPPPKIKKFKTSQYRSPSQDNILAAITDLVLRLDRVEQIIQKDVSDVVSLGEDFQLFPIRETKYVFKLEKDLNNEDFKKKIFSHFGRIIGTSTPWKTACYKLCNIIFTKEVLTCFSWTGMSRRNNKESFKNLKNTLDIFYRAVYKADNTFSYSQRDAFFRDGILKHSNTRLKQSQKLKQRNGKGVEKEREEEEKTEEEEENENEEMQDYREASDEIEEELKLEYGEEEKQMMEQEREEMVEHEREIIFEYEEIEDSDKEEDIKILRQNCHSVDNYW